MEHPTAPARPRPVPAAAAGTLLAALQEGRLRDAGHLVAGGVADDPVPVLGTLAARALDVLDLLDAAGAPTTASALARTAGLHRTPWAAATRLWALALRAGSPEEAFVSVADEEAEHHAFALACLVAGLLDRYAGLVGAPEPDVRRLLWS
ncbi:hypothetical protein [Vallicoccus soli]|uniref:Uncharacterized protein n=1 Tax=Vallicoccus soli TaxID=2339232 RepID=A0A3A3Z1F8_9ACTN|nr:hypothetical protein [Vallicoccus soli]RJK94227.1 hypothetical protein D5H78_14630 [Vallicoccus soli]